MASHTPPFPAKPIGAPKHFHCPTVPNHSNGVIRKMPSAALDWMLDSLMMSNSSSTHSLLRPSSAANPLAKPFPQAPPSPSTPPSMDRGRFTMNGASMTFHSPTAVESPVPKHRNSHSAPCPPHAVEITPSSPATPPEAPPV